jgi:hypothetical protein
MNDVEKNEVEFEQEMRGIFARVDAPETLKARILAARDGSAQNVLSIEVKPRKVQWHLMARIAATVLLTVGVGGALIEHHYDEQRKAEKAREQLYLALQITHHAFQHVQDRLAEKGQRHE